MPAALVKSFAEKSGKSIADVERYWDEAKVEAKKKFKKKSSNFWAYVAGIVKRRAGLSENLSFREFTMLESLGEPEFSDSTDSILIV